MTQESGQHVQGGGIVRRRRVIYIPGYDPAHSRKYRELYRAQGQRQAELSGYRLSLAAAKGGGEVFAWDVAAEIEGQAVATRVEALVWSDIVRRSMEGGVFTIYGHLARTAWIYFSTGAIFRLMRLRKGPVIAAFYPVVALLGQLALALGTAWGLGALIAALTHPDLGLAALAVVPPILAWFRARDGKVLAHYLMHDFAFTAEHAGAEPPALTARMADFADRIADALTSDADEVLVVGHSSGAQIAVSVLARLLREGRVPEPGRGPALSFLTLGQVIPMAAFLPRADALRADLALVSRSAALTWVDVSAPGDGCTFALCDPVAVSGAAGPGKRWPLVLSAAYTRTLRPDTWAKLRWRFFRLHFQYLCAFDALPGRPDDYDYFRITAGPRTLAARLGGRTPSPARIERALSGHTVGPGAASVVA
ncbi:MAG: hypothetical protein AAGG09_18160 [Pseudomonadota bacterium]